MKKMDDRDLIDVDFREDRKKLMMNERRERGPQKTNRNKGGYEKG